jgi:hypothetical protein
VGQELFERRLQLSAALRELSFFKVADARNAGRLLDNDQVSVNVDQPQIFAANRFRQRFLPDFQHIAGGNASCRIEAEVAVDLDATSGDELPRVSPRALARDGTDRRRECLPGRKVREMIDPKRGFGGAVSSSHPLSLASGR